MARCSLVINNQKALSADHQPGLPLGDRHLLILSCWDLDPQAHHKQRHQTNTTGPLSRAVAHRRVQPGRGHTFTRTRLTGCYSRDRTPQWVLLVDMKARCAT